MENEKKDDEKRSYVVVTGINYKTAKGEKRANPGDKVSDIPSRSVRWLVEAGAIKEMK
jgi:hypothetical protein